MLEMIKTYKENTRLINEIGKKRSELREETDKKRRKIRKRYFDRIHELKSEENKKIERLDELDDKKEKISSKRIGKLHEPIGKVNRIIKLMKLDQRFQGNWKEWLDFDESKIKAYNERYTEKLGVFYQDEFLKIALYIFENRKPKNKYTLCAIGRSLFPEEMLVFGYSYGLDLNTAGSGFTIASYITDMPSVDELKEYLKKMRDSLFKPHLEQYQKVKKEYLGVLDTFKFEDFKGIMKYKCNKCWFFLTEKEARGISIRDDKCMKEGCKGKLKMLKV